MQTPGLIVAPLTPFTSDLAVDESALQRQIDYVVRDCGATMVVAAGVETQEYTYLSLERRKDLIRRTIELVGGRVPVMVGISHASYKTSIELAHDAEKWGAAAVQLLAPLRPFAGPPNQADLIAYFEAIGRETRLPITLYLNPGPGADVSIPDTIALAKLPNVQLIKESSRDLARVSRLIVEIDRAGHARYFTTMQMLLATLQLGGSGATMPPPGSEIARHVIDAFMAKDHERAAELQLQFALFPSKWMHRGLAPAMKAAMNLIGIPVGDPYPPSRRSAATRLPRSPPRCGQPCWRPGSRLRRRPESPSIEGATMTQQQVAPPSTPYGAPISIEAAKNAMAAAEAVAIRNNLGVAIAIVDSGGNLVMLHRLDNAQLSAARIAEAKARTAVEFRRPTKALEDAVAGGGVGLRVLTFGASVAEGGVLIVAGGRIVGGIGVSGVASHQDAQVAQAGSDALK